MNLPPGFRFHPTDEELITHYLCNKVVDPRFSATAIGDVDLNKCEPWDLPKKAKMGEKECYFFCVKDRKYPTGLRTNRATQAGYWKATGKDKEIFRAKSLIGMKKTLVFYEGRAPKGEKTNWVMHEFRLEGKHSPQNLPKTSQNEWVICRVFEKNPGGKKTHVPGNLRTNPFNPSVLIPLPDPPPYTGHTRSPTAQEPQHVPCFSNPNINFPETAINCFAAHNSLPDNLPTSYPAPISPYDLLPPLPSPMSWPLSGPSSAHDQVFLNDLVHHSTPAGSKQSLKTEGETAMSISQETGASTELHTDMSSVISNLDMGMGGRPFHHQVGPGQFGSIWNYQL